MTFKINKITSYVRHFLKKAGLAAGIFAAVLTLCVFVSAGDEAEASGRIIGLMYHDLSNDTEAVENNPSWSTTGDKFREDIEKLLAAGYKSLSCEELVNGDYDSSENYFIITFDDGYLSNYMIAYPIMKELNVKGDIFINTSATMRANHFRYYQANAMEKSGIVKIYSHLTTHMYADDLGCERFCQEADKSFEALEKSLAADRIKMFAYPGGIYTEETYLALKARGVKLQLVQNKPSFEYDPADFLIRYSIGYDTDMNQIIG